MAVKILQFSDIHFTDGAEVMGRDPATALRRALAQASEHHGDAGVCVFSGDLAAHGGESEYRALKAELRNVPIASRYLLGNHDDRANFLEVFQGVEIDDLGSVQSTADVGRFRCLFLDTLAPGQAKGELSGGRLDWIDTTLGAADRPCLIVMHHPPISTHSPGFDAIGLRDAHEFAAVIRRHRGRIRQIYFGHCHFTVAGAVDGVPALGVKSVLYQNWPNFEDRRFVGAIDAPGAYGVILGDPDELATHIVEFGYPGRLVSSDDCEGEDDDGAH